jgi:hypothetical protein
VTSDDDDAQVLAKMAALEAEVKIDLARQRARKEKAMELLAAKKAALAAQNPAAAPMAPGVAALVVAPVAPAVVAKPAPKIAAKALPEPSDDDLQRLLDEVAPPPASKQTASKQKQPAKAKADGKAIVKVKAPSTPKTPRHKSWKTSGLVSTALGPIGWLYAGAWREAIPASVLFVALGYLLQFLPSIILWPALMIGLPSSGIAGALYASRYNKRGGRQRLFGADDSQAKLSAGKK